MIDMYERRTCQRAILKDAVRFRPRNSENTEGSLSCDISESGVKISCGKFIPLNTELVLEINLGAGCIVDFVGRVVWISRMPFSERYQMGIQFIEEGSVQSSVGKIRSFVQSVGGRDRLVGRI